MRYIRMPHLFGFTSLGPLVLRVITGWILAAHGWNKLQNGPENFANTLQGLNVPAPEFMAWVVSLTEFVGGIMLLVGLLSRVVSFAILIEMIFTIALVKADVGLIAPQGTGAGAELDLLVWGVAAAVMIMGPGRVSIDWLLGLELESGEQERGVGQMPDRDRAPDRDREALRG